MQNNMKGKVFTAQEVQSILNKSKVMFREVIKPYPILSADKSYWEFKGVRWAGEKSSYAKNFGDNAKPEMPDLCPYKVGEEIFVKESFCRDPRQGVNYKQEFLNHDLPEEFAPDWISASYMQKWASRLTLLIKSVGVERLGDISEEDARKEVREFWLGGFGWQYENYDNLFLKQHERRNSFDNAKDSFKTLWNATHKNPKEKWEASPWVCCVSFEVVR